MEFRYAGKTGESIVDGPGLRYTLFVQGCPHNCEGCHNPQTHDFNGGTLRDTDEIFEEIMENPLLDGVTFSGGEPFCQAKQLADLGRKLKKENLNVIVYTGFTFEYLLSHANDENGYLELINVADYIIDGKFVLALKSYEAKFRGSTNQRIIDVKKSLETNETVTADI